MMNNESATVIFMKNVPVEGLLAILQFDLRHYRLPFSGQFRKKDAYEKRENM